MEGGLIQRLSVVLPLKQLIHRHILMKIKHKATQSRFADYYHHFSNITSRQAVIIYYSLAIFIH